MTSMITGEDGALLPRSFSPRWSHRYARREPDHDRANREGSKKSSSLPQASRYPARRQICLGILEEIVGFFSNALVRNGWDTGLHRGDMSGEYRIITSRGSVVGMLNGLKEQSVLKELDSKVRQIKSDKSLFASNQIVISAISKVKRIWKRHSHRIG